MSATEWTIGWRPKIAGASALNAATRLWFLLAVIGQWAFLYYIVAFYGVSTSQGHIEAWGRNTMLFKGYVAGDLIGNRFFGGHVLIAAIIAFGGLMWRPLLTGA